MYVHIYVLYMYIHTQAHTSITKYLATIKSVIEIMDMENDKGRKTEKRMHIQNLSQLFKKPYT